MDNKIRCQSCGQPMSDEFWGTEANGTNSTLYCTFCYHHGEFTEPTLTVGGMIQKSVTFMTQTLHMDPQSSQSLSQSIIPLLARWKKT